MEKIFVFGHEQCKYCHDQFFFMNNAFDEKDWVYVDLTKKNNLKIAMEINKEIDIENIPATIILDKDGNQIILKEKGLIPPDRIFSYLYSNKMPIPSQDIKKVISGEKSYILSTFKPDFKINQRISACKYNGDKICDVIIQDIVWEKVDDLIRKNNIEDMENYFNFGGKKMGHACKIDFIRGG